MLKVKIENLTHLKKEKFSSKKNYNKARFSDIKKIKTVGLIFFT